MRVSDGYYLVLYRDFDTFKEWLLTSGRLTRQAQMKLSTLTKDQVSIWSRGENYGDSKYRERYSAVLRLRGKRKMNISDCRVAVENPCNYVKKWVFADKIIIYEERKSNSETDIIFAN